MKKIIIISNVGPYFGFYSSAQQNAYVVFQQRMHVKARGADMGEVKWTKGFERPF